MNELRNLDGFAENTYSDNRMGQSDNRGGLMLEKILSPNITKQKSAFNVFKQSIDHERPME